MITFCVSTGILVLAYFLYGPVVDRVIGIDPERKTPSETMYDGVDYVPLSWPRIFLIQLLNIAGLGPVFGAVLGALWGPVAFLWIVFGGIFIGAVHDYVSGFISLREGGANLHQIIGKYLGDSVRKIMVLLTLVLLLVVGVLFVMGPARIMADLCVTGTVQSTAALDGAKIEPAPLALVDGPIYTKLNFWVVIIFMYYFLATLLPIDQIIGRIYPLFGACLLLMVLIISARILTGQLVVPELTLANLHPAGKPIWPMMMITIACGAISGFHATQSPMMARALTSERYARRCFFGAMLCESFIALVWAAAAMGFCHGSTELLLKTMGPKVEAVLIVKSVAMSLGFWGMIISLLGVVALPITTGDTAFRAARLILADVLGQDQKPIINRLSICIPMFALGIYLCQMDFGLLWQYLSWLNQGLAAFTLWACTVYLRQNNRNFWITLLPAVFMTLVSISYILIEGKIGFGLAVVPGSAIAAFLSLGILALVVQRFFLIPVKVQAD